MADDFSHHPTQTDTDFDHYSYNSSQTEPSSRLFEGTCNSGISYPVGHCLSNIKLLRCATCVPNASAKEVSAVRFGKQMAAEIECNYY